MVLRHSAKASLCAAALAAGGAWLQVDVRAGCPCQGGGGSMVSAPIAAPYVAAPVPVYSAPPVTVHAPTQQAVSTDMWGPAGPPPGTLGQTYQLKSRPVPAAMHPRTAMLDLKVSNASTVIVHSMNPNLAEDRLSGFQDQHDPNMWHFQSEPLLPGLSHVYRIEAQIAGPNGVTTQQRYVRLIMGRLLEVSF